MIFLIVNFIKRTSYNRIVVDLIKMLSL